MSELKVEAGKTVVVKGPASISLVEGRANILGYPMNPKRPVVVKSWRARPVYVEENSLFKYTCGEGGGIEVIDGDTVPPEWREIVSEITQLRKVAVSVYGSIDSGKTSLATLAANYLATGSEVAYLDLDIGQSSICPPTTIGCVYLRRPVPEISALRAEEGEVVGYTSPAPLVTRHVEACQRLLEKMRERGEALVVADLDGWVSGEAAISHKLMLIEAVKPTHILSIGDVPSEVRVFCEENGVELKELPRPLIVRRREPEARKKLREMGYERFLRKSTVRRLQASWIKLESIGGEREPRTVFEKAVELASSYLEEQGLIADVEESMLLEGLARKRVGILSYIYGLDGRFKAIGLLMALNLQRNYLKIYTPFQEQIKRLVVGSIVLSAAGEELYSTPPQVSHY